MDRTLIHNMHRRPKGEYAFPAWHVDVVHGLKNKALDSLLHSYVVFLMHAAMIVENFVCGQKT